MIISLPRTSTSQISRTIDEQHEERGEAASGRVLTLLITTDSEHLEQALEVANGASREHPCRVIAVVNDTHEALQEASLDAQVRFGADAGAGEVIVLKPSGGLIRHLDTLVIPLLVPDAPVVAWWPNKQPDNPSKDPLGVMARSRITDAMGANNPQAAFTALRANYSYEDTDMSWTRLTMWRATLASVLSQQPPSPIQSVKVVGHPGHISVDLMGAWLALRLNVPVVTERCENSEGISDVQFTCEDGSTFGLSRVDGRLSITMPGEQSAQTVPMPLRTPEECLSEELRRLDPDEVYADVLENGWSLVDHE